jgi:hypothetical protein
MASSQQAHTRFSIKSGMKITDRLHNFVPGRIISALKRIEIVSDKMYFIILRGRCCDIFVLSIHTPIKGKVVPVLI